MEEKPWELDDQIRAACRTVAECPRCPMLCSASHMHTLFYLLKKYEERFDPSERRL